MYHDYVVVNSLVEVWQGPAWTLGKGDMVETTGEDGTFVEKVLEVITLEDDEADKLNFIRICSHQREFPKVVAYYKRREVRE